MRSAALCLVVTAAVSAAATARAQDEVERARQAYDAGVRLYTAGRYAEALAQFQQAYEAVPNAATLYSVATCEQLVGAGSEEVLGNFDAALEHFQYAIDAADATPELRAQATEARQRCGAAAQAYRTGRQLSDEERYEEALVAFDQSFGLVPHFVTRLNIAACNEFAGHYREAGAAYQEVLGRPDLPPEMQEEVREALTRVTEAQQLAPTRGGGEDQSADRFDAARQAYTRGEQLFGGGQYDQALAAFQQSYDLVPFPDTLYNIASCYEALGRYSDARIRYYPIITLADAPPELQQQAREAFQRVSALERQGVGSTVQPVGPAQPGAGGLARTGTTDLFARLDTERPHEGPGGYLFIGGAGPMGGGVMAENGGAGVAGGLGFLWRVIPNLSLAFEFAIAMNELKFMDEYGSEETASTTYLDFVGGLRYHMLSKGVFDPWVGAYAGYARWTGAVDPADATDSYFTGALLLLQAGVDFFISNFISLGVRFDAHVPFWLEACTSGGDCEADLAWTGDPAGGGNLESDDMPFWWAFSAGGTFYFLLI
jgi:tetratricopeptide (TPR) repeat protein